MSSWMRWDLNKELLKIKDWDYFLGRAKKNESE